MKKKTIEKDLFINILISQLRMKNKIKWNEIENNKMLI